MASFQDLQMDWDSLCQECTDCWTTTDLQLAAELGKTLLERNKELENNLKQHQTVIDDQTQEIEYLTKQTAALREVNDSRLRIYEQLEVSIQDLERANHRLSLDNQSDKRQIKTLSGNNESLEAKCEELQNTVDELTFQLDSLKRKSQKHERSQTIESTTKSQHERSFKSTFQCDSSSQTERHIEPKKMGGQEADSGNEELYELLSQLKENRTVLMHEQRRVAELEEQLVTIIQRNKSLEDQLIQIQNKEDECIKSMQEEFTTLEEVREGHLCSRCLRNTDSPRIGDDMSLSLCDDPEDDDSSMLEAITSQTHHSSFSLEVQDHPLKSPSPQRQANVYRDLVEKYEALRRHVSTRPAKSSHSLSLQEEMLMSGEYSQKDADEESGNGESLKTEKSHKKDRKSVQTPTDFSEAETSSSGFSDETSNKATQTEGRAGSFLCTIADGDDCKFSIYDDANPIGSRFRNSPEYRELFREIFTVLKKAAANKDEGEELPLLDDHTPVKSLPKVPPVTPSNDSFPDFPDNFTDDSQSVLSSTMSEISNSLVDNTIISSSPLIEKPKKEIVIKEPVLTPYKRQPFEYLSVSVRKRSSSRRNKKQADRSESPITPILGSPKITYSSRTQSGRKRKEFRNLETANGWDGSTVQFINSSIRPQSSNRGAYKYENGYTPSTASQELIKLKKLDLSYAEVLKHADNKKRHVLNNHRRK